MRTSPELLNDILNVLGKINSNIESMKGSETKRPTGPETKETKATKGIGLNLGDLTANKNKTDNLKNTAASIKDLSSALGPLSSGLIKFGLIPERYKKSTIEFINQLLMASTIKGIKATVYAKDLAEAIGIIADALPKLAKGLWQFGLVPGMFKNSIIHFMRKILGQDLIGGIKTKDAPKQAKLLAEAMNILGDALPKLAKGVFRFGIMQKLGLVAATVVGIETLIAALAVAGNPATLPFVLAGAAAIAAVGLALNGIANVLKSISLLVLAFAGAIVIMVGAIWMASKLFKVGPLKAMLIIIGAIGILAAGFALIGIMAPLIARGGKAVKELGIGMALAGLGILAFVGALKLANMITGSQEDTDKAIGSALRSIALMSLVFAGIGIFGGLIKRGGDAVQHMGKGMIWVAGGLLVLGGVYALLTKVMGIDMGEMIVSIAKGLAVLGLVFAGLGLLSILIIPGTIALFAIGISLGIFALISLGIGAVIKKLGGKEGITTMSNNIGLLVGGVLNGIIKGVSSALLGDSTGKGFFGKLTTVGKNVTILIGSIFLLIGVSWALIMFATALRAFQKPGVIKDKDGKDINVVATSDNIAKSISAFFKTLVDTFNDPKKLPNKAAVESMVDMLMGNHGYKKLGIRRDLNKPPRPGLIDAIQKFAEAISIFSRVNQLPVYEVDEKTGKTKLQSYIGPEQIATNMAKTIKAFFTAFSGKQTELENLSTTTSYNIAEILLGKSAFKIFGFTLFGRKEGRPGILDALQKFSQVLSVYAKFGEENKIYTEYNEDGTPKLSSGKDIKLIANNMVAGISQFMTAFNTAFATGTGKDIEGQSGQIFKRMDNFGKVISKLSSFSTNLTDIDKLAITIGSLATSIGELSANMGALDVEKLEKAMKTMNANSKNLITSAPSPLPLSQYTQQSKISFTDEELNKIGDKIGEAVAAKLTVMNNNTGGEFNFHFYRENEGTLSIGK